MEVFRHGSVGIDLYEEIEVASFRFIGHGGVGADDGLFGVGRLEFCDDCGWEWSVCDAEGNGVTAYMRHSDRLPSLQVTQR